VAAKPKAKKPKKLTRAQLAVITRIELKGKYDKRCLYFDMVDECMEAPLLGEVAPAVDPDRPMVAVFATPCAKHAQIVYEARVRIVPPDAWMADHHPSTAEFHKWILENFPRLKEMIDAEHALHLYDNAGTTDSIKKILEERKSQQK
jgi:hypothetical protein